MDPLRAALQEHFGFPDFRPGQRPTIEALMAGRPVVGVMPTGRGKSLCYQLPSLLLDGVTLVVSPLIALMKDQVDALRGRGIPAAYLNSTQDYQAQRDVLASVRQGAIKLLYVAPERFRFGGAMAQISRLPIGLFAVDEAHCISHWGHDFRPDYMALGQVARDLGAQRVAAFTATATPEVRDDIVRRLGMVEPHVTVSGFLRDNLHLSVVHVRKMAEKRKHILTVVRGLEGSAVIYCATRKNCEKVGAHLLSHGVDALVYHAGLSDQERSAAQNAFTEREDAVIVATNAFGMGVDKPNVRAVIHYDMPGSLSAYYQEAGRAGRDGQRAACTILFTYADVRIHEFFMDNGAQELPYDQRDDWLRLERAKLKAMVRYAYEESCRHAAILTHFGEQHAFDFEEGCGVCDNCTGETGLRGVGSRPPASRDRSGSSRRERAPRAPAQLRSLSEDEEVLAQKVLSAIARSRGRLSVTQLARVLRGVDHADLGDEPLRATPSWGLCGEYGHNDLTAFIKALGRAGCTRGRRPELTRVGVEVMMRRAQVEVDAPVCEPRRRPRKTASSPPLDLDHEARELLERLKAKRLELAKERQVPAYVVATNRVLTQLATVKPADARADWLALDGVGEKSVDPLRDAFAELISSHAPA